MSDPVILKPDDDHNRRLISRVHPADWRNPEPAGRYNLVVIGGGTAGLVTAAGAAGLGARVALVERDLLGGDCLNVGCVPSKAIIRPARTMALLRQARREGISFAEAPTVDFAAVMARMRRIRADIGAHDSAERLKSLGVDVFLGRGRFVDSKTIDVDGTRLCFRRAVIATGARAFIPPVEGLGEAGCLTNETVFSLTACPKRLLVVGAGPIGVEMAQTFQRLGAEVVLVEQMARILPREDPEASAVLTEALVRDGVDVRAGAVIERVTVRDGVKCAWLRHGDTAGSVEVDEILIGIGRVPNVDGLNLDGVGVAYDARAGVKVDTRMRTTNRRIYACGDICSPYKFTHAADFMARIVIRNALFFGRGTLNTALIPWCTYTDPEIARVGLYEAEAEAEGIAVDSFTVPFRDVDRALLDEETEGFFKVHVRKGTGRILGATLVSPHAGESIGEVALAMAQGVSLGKLSGVMHPYPTQAESIRKSGDLYLRGKLSPRIAGLIRRFLAWRR